MEQRLSSLIQRFLTIFFRYLYTHLAIFYDAVAWTSSMGQWRQWQSAAIIDFKEGAILELGHGPGHVQLDLHQSFHTTYGLDLSAQMTKIARRRLRKAGYPMNIVRGKAQVLPFASQSFRSVVSTFPSEYIVDGETLREIWRVLSPDGILIIVGVIEITGKSLPDRFARWLYNTTGQSGAIPHNWEQYFYDHGFDPRLEEVKMQRSRVSRVIARRKQTMPSSGTMAEETDSDHGGSGGTDKSR